MNNLPDYINVGASAGTNAGRNAEIQTNMGTNARMNAEIQTNAVTNVNRQSLASQLTGIADQLKSIATSLSTNGPMPMPSSKLNVVRNTGLSKTKRVRSAAQLARNENIRKASANLRAKGYKSSLKSIHELLKHRKEGKKNEDYFSTLGLPTITEVVEEAAVAEGEGNATGAAGAANAAVKNHATAGKKAVTSEKGSKWLEEIKSAKNLINTEYTKSGLKRTAKRQNATKVASLMRKNEAAARNYISQLMKA